MASTHHVPRPDRNSRLGLAALTVAGMAMFVWVVASLALAAFA